MSKDVNNPALLLEEIVKELKGNPELAAKVRKLYTLTYKCAYEDGRDDEVESWDSEDPWGV